MTRLRALAVGMLTLGASIAAVSLVSAEQLQAPVRVEAETAWPEQAGEFRLAQAGPQKAPDRLRGAVAAPEEKGPNTGWVSLALGADWVSGYYFRGIVFEKNGGSNVQAYIEPRFRLLEDLGPLTSLTLAGGNWNSFHWGGGQLAEPSDPKWWFEANLYAKLTATWWKVLSTGVIYTYYDSPSNSFDPLSDVAVNLALDDSKWLGAFALNPSVLFAFQTKGHFLPEAKPNGIYMGFSLAPGYTFFKDSKFPVNVSLPMTIGLSLRDYYTVNGTDQTLGYFEGGPLITIPLTFIPKNFGQWALKGSAQALWLNSNLKTVNQGNGWECIGTVGVSMTY